MPIRIPAASGIVDSTSSGRFYAQRDRCHAESTDAASLS